MSANIQAAAGRGGRGAPGGRFGGRGVSSRPVGQQKTASPEFKGRCEELKGHVIDCGQAKHADQFSRTMKEVINYVGSHISDGEWVARSLRTEKLVVITRPTAPKDPDDIVEKAIFDATVKQYVSEMSRYASNMRQTYHIIMGQCTQNVINHLKALHDYEQMEEEADVLLLVKLLKKIVFNFEEQKNVVDALLSADENFHKYRQGNDVSNDTYYREFESYADVINQSGGLIGVHPILLKKFAGEVKFEELPSYSRFSAQLSAGKMLIDSEWEALVFEWLGKTGAIVQEAYMATSFLKKANGKYKDLVRDLENSYTLGEDKYPTTMVSAYHMLTHWKTNDSGGRFIRPLSSDGVSLATKAGTRDKSFIKCFSCGNLGHFAYECPSKASNAEKLNATVDQSEKEPSSSTDVSRQTAVSNGQDDKLADPQGPRQYKFLTTTSLAGADSGEFIMTNKEAVGSIPQSWILLDSQSTCNVFKNKSLLTNVRRAPHPVVIYSQGGSTKVTHWGNFGSIKNVWLDENGIANILSLAKMNQTSRVVYDSENGNTFIVYVPGQPYPWSFTQSKEGLFYYDLNEKPFTGHTDKALAQYACVETVFENMQGYTRRQVKNAKRARDGLELVGFPSIRDFQSMVRLPLIKNCPLTIADIKIAQDVYGPDIPSLKGKTVRQQPPSVVTDYIQIPLEIYERNQEIIVVGDVMFVSGLPFLVTVSRGIDLVTSEYLPDVTAISLRCAVNRVIKVYQRKGFIVRTALADGQFECVRDHLKDTDLNATAAAEHAPEIERKIRVIKERHRALSARMPFDAVPGRIIVESIAFIVMWLNAFPSKNGCSETYSPRAIMTNTSLDWKLHCRAPFGSFCQVYVDTQPHNSPSERMVDAICMGPTGNLQGSYKFFTLDTMEKITRPQFVMLPMPKAVIQRIHKIAQMEGRPNLLDLKFTAGNGEVTDVNDVASSVDVPAMAGVHDYNSPQQEVASVDIPDLFDDGGVDSIPPPLTEPYYGGGDLWTHGSEDRDNRSVPSVKSEYSRSEHSGSLEDSFDSHVYDESTVSGTGEESFNVEIPSDEEYFPTDVSGNETTYEPSDPSINRLVHELDQGLRDNESASNTSPSNGTPEIPNRNLRGNRVRDYSYRFGFASIDYEEKTSRPRYTRGYSMALQVLTQAPDYEFHYTNMLHETQQMVEDKDLDGMMTMAAYKVMVILAGKMLPYTGARVMAQYGLKKGLKAFGVRGAESVQAELSQIHMRNTFTPTKMEDLTPEQRRKAIESLIFLEEKRSGDIKSRMCADGRKQREDIDREDTTSPTVMTESVLITAAIDAEEGRDVAVIDLPGAFLHADMDDLVVMVLRGELAELMAAVAPEIYRKYITYGKDGKAILYVTLQKALYGTLKAALLFYRKLVSELKGRGFKINEYDPCVATKMVNDEQMTITWHVDDLKISHMDREVVGEVVEWFKSIYGNVRVSRGYHHDYLGMDIDFSYHKQLRISMVNHLKKMISEFPEAITSNAVTPATDKLFEVRPDNDPNKRLLDESRARAFHHAVAQALFVTTRYRHDIRTAIAFLCTRVKRPDEDDWGKLKRLLKYIRGTLYLVLTIQASNLKLGFIQWYVDAAFAVHEDFKSHTGAGMTLGKGILIGISRKQKLNTKSSTEGELVAVDDASGQIIWTNYFLESLGYHINCTVVYQDNQSAILLEKNGKESSSRRTRHMNIRYFFITDRVKSGELVIRYCPTGEMLADHFTKPLQGEAFYKFRSQIMNIDPGLTGADWAWDRAFSSSPSPQECVGDPSSSDAKVLMENEKLRTDGANMGGRGADVKALGHGTVTEITPFSSDKKFMRFHDLGAAAA